MQDQQEPQASIRNIPANFCTLRHTNEEFIIDIGMSGVDPRSGVDPKPRPNIDSSIVISPFTAKRLWKSLGAIVANYEQSFGEIETESENRMIAPRPTPLGVQTTQVPATPQPLINKHFNGAPAPPIIDDLETAIIPQAVPQAALINVPVAAPQTPQTPQTPQAIQHEAVVVPFSAEAQISNSPCIPGAEFGTKDSQ